MYLFSHGLRAIILSSPPTISSLKITDCSFRHASPRLWNLLPDSFRQPSQSCLESPPHSLVIITTISILHSFTPGSKPRLLLPPGQPSRIMGPDRTYYAHRFIFSNFSSFFTFLFVPCGRLSWLNVSFLQHVKYTASYHHMTRRNTGSH